MNNICYEYQHRHKNQFFPENVRKNNITKKIQIMAGYFAMARVINEREFAEMVNSNNESNSSRPLVVDCYTDWCAPCKVSAPIYEQMSIKFKDQADFVKINVDKNQGVAMKLRVRNIPTFIILIGNQVVSRIVGANMKKLEGSIKEVLDKN
ncbi:MAG: thioredoxin family protein [Candidatus Hodarchaeales archaeon]